jgi:hypothetical protein
MKSVDEQYKEWYEKQEFKKISTDELKSRLLQELKEISSMTVEEYTLWRKWREITENYPLVNKKEEKEENVFLFFKKHNDSEKKKKTKKENSVKPYPEIHNIRKKIWIPEKPEDYLKLEPTLIQTDDKNIKTWNILRTFTSTMLNNSNIGRNIRFIIKDKKTKKYLGVICLSSDFMDLTPRDNYIGWSREVKTKQKMINHTTIGSTIVPTQPLGFSFVGGKLLALLTISNITEEAWNKRYKDKLVAYTTTSLYGSFSQYQNLKYWNKRGHSAGSIRYEPTTSTVIMAREWLKAKEPRKYFEWYAAKNPQGLPLKRDHKQRSLSFIYRKLEIPKEYIESSHRRGIYFCTLFENSCEFLRKEITEEELKRRFDNSVGSLVEIWKEKYAKKRVKNLLEKKRYSTNTLFYDRMIGRSWEETKEVYLGDVGR